MHKHPSVRIPAHVSIGLFDFVMITSAVLVSIRTFPVERLNAKAGNRKDLR